MPRGGLNIYFGAVDGMSPVLATIGDKTKALDKETQQLRQSYQALQKANNSLIERKTALTKELSEAKDEAKEAKKAFEQLGDEISRDDYEKAQAKVAGLKNEISAVNKAMRENTQIYNQNLETVRKGALGGSGVLSALGQAGVWSTLGGVAGDWATTLAGSALGSSAGNVFGSALGMAGQGAAIGTMIGGPGVGTAVGAALGGLVGAIQGLTQTYEDQDAAFKEYYGNLFDAVNEQTSSMISSGSTIAGSREQTQMAFARRFGSDAAAEAYLGRVQEMAARTNYGYDEITGYSQLLLNSYDPEEVFGVLQSLSDATAALNLTSSDVSMMISGLSRMRTTGKTTQEYLNYFSERGVDVYDALAGATGADRSQIAEMVTDGAISGETAAQAILDYIDREYGGLSEDLMGTYDAMVDNLADIKATIEAAGGEGYNTLRKEGVQAETDAYGGALGQAVSLNNQIAGGNQAYFENLLEEYTRGALSAVLMDAVPSGSLFSEEEAAQLQAWGDEYKEALYTYNDAVDKNSEEARGAAVTMERLREQAEALAQVAYDNDDLVLEQMDQEEDMISAIRDAIVATDNLTGALSNYRVQQEQSKGMGSGIVGEALAGHGALDEGGSAFQHPLLKSATRSGARGYAVGLDRVPYDNFPALLHQGERVLTANEARAQDREGGRQIVVNISGEWHVRSDADVDAIAGALVDKLLLAQMAG